MEFVCQSLGGTSDVNNNMMHVSVSGSSTQAFRSTISKMGRYAQDNTIHDHGGMPLIPTIFTIDMELMYHSLGSTSHFKNNGIRLSVSLCRS